MVINGVNSPWAEINAGAPQGSILGPLLFLVYINDIVDTLETTPYLFGDDTSLSEVIDKNAPNVSFEKINSDLVKLNNWAKQWRIDFNSKKNVYMAVSSKKEPPQYSDLYLAGDKLNRVTDHSHLGITIDSKLSLKEHVKKICKKASSRVNGIKRISFLIPRCTRETLYLSMMRPILDYGSVVLGNMKLYGVEQL